MSDEHSHGSDAAWRDWKPVIWRLESGQRDEMTMWESNGRGSMDWKRYLGNAMESESGNNPVLDVLMTRRREYSDVYKYLNHCSFTSPAHNTYSPCRFLQKHKNTRHGLAGPSPLHIKRTTRNCYACGLATPSWEPKEKMVTSTCLF